MSHIYILTSQYMNDFIVSKLKYDETWWHKFAIPILWEDEAEGSQVWG